MKKYQVIYADPPWQFNSKRTGGNMKSGAAQHYNCMTLDEMKAMPINEITEDNALLVMWWVGAMPQEAIDLVEAWGFTLKNMNGFVWEKLTVHHNPVFGLGYYTRAGSESAIIAVKGKFKPQNRSVRAVRSAPVGRHSEKPHEFREDILKLAGDVPRLELFARTAPEGWDVFGNECDRSIELMEAI
ncbi:TPA: MT-A70 family methyltransferase [Vibrio vulnificus]